MQPKMEGVNNKTSEIENNEGWKIIEKKFHDLHIVGSQWEDSYSVMKRFLENLEVAAKTHGLNVRHIKSGQYPESAEGDPGLYYVRYEVSEIVDPYKLISKEEILNSND